MYMSFQKGFYIPKVEELIDNAFKKARDEASKVQERDFNRRIIEKEKTRVKIASEEITGTLKNIANKFPNISELNPLYKSLLANSLDIIQLKKALSHLMSSSRTCDELKTQFLAAMFRVQNKNGISKYRNEFYGRLVSVVKRCKASFEIIKNAMKNMAEIPKIKNLPTILLIGCPNTGKSTFLKAVTSANVEIQSYPFTTKRLQVGMLTEKFLEFQLLDSPGLLDRPEEKQNNIEKQTTLALKTIADSLIFIIGANENINNQINILKRFKKEIKYKPFFIVINKIDLVDMGELKEIESALKNYLPQKTHIFKLSLNKAKEQELKEIKDEIYNLNKSWYTKKGKENIKSVF